MSSHQQQVREYECCSDRNRRVGNVEGPEVPAAPVDVHVVEDVADSQTIDQVADRAAEDERESDPRQFFVTVDVRA
jgi:hypothetical protein